MSGNITEFFSGAAKANFGTVIGIFRRNQLARKVSSFEASFKQSLHKDKRRERLGIKYFKQNPLEEFLAEQFIYMKGLNVARQLGFLVIDLTFKQATRSCESACQVLEKMSFFSNSTGFNGDISGVQAECNARTAHMVTSHIERSIEGRIGPTAAQKIK